MAVVAEKSVVATRQRPRLKVAQQTSEMTLAREEVCLGARTWTQELLERRYLMVVSSILVAIALYVDYRCGSYVTFRPAVKVPDLILDRIPPINLSFLFTYGYMALIVGMFTYPLFRQPRTLYVVAIQFSLLLILRSVFMIFTHVGTPAGAVDAHFPGLFSKLYFENDMFFSGHTAMPFLGFYLFRQSRLRYVYLVGSIVMGIVVLAMHVHYSIDVLGAFFMTYCSYQMGSALIRKLDPAYCDS
ncbi:MAG: phosphatase PAP2-related protein [Phycisphaerae bacterium]|nr:phosphatase PAP2-related protein [Phycisphaerae bacterium]